MTNTANSAKLLQVVLSYDCTVYRNLSVHLLQIKGIGNMVHFIGEETVFSFLPPFSLGPSLIKVSPFKSQFFSLRDISMSPC